MKKETASTLRSDRTVKSLLTRNGGDRDGSRTCVAIDQDECEICMYLQTYSS